MTKHETSPIENKITQLRKGVLELAIMGVLSHTRTYGYSLVRALTADGACELTEGTIYPILGRMTKEGLVQSAWIESAQGPPRKYYSLTPGGRELYAVLSAEFHQLVRLVENAGKRTPGEAGENTGTTPS